MGSDETSYEEIRKRLSRVGCKPIWIAVAFVVAFFLYLGRREFSTEEALLVTAAREILRNGEWLQFTVLNQSVDLFPLPVWLTQAGLLLKKMIEPAIEGVFSYASFVNHLVAGSGTTVFLERCVRLTSVIAVGVMVLFTGLATRKRVGALAGAVAAMAVCTNPLVLQYGSKASGEGIFAALICGAWFCLYWRGRLGKRWNQAWALAILLTTIAAAVQGFIAFVYFYVPLLFLPRALGIRRRMLTPRHLVSIGGVLALASVGYGLFFEHRFFPWVGLNFVVFGGEGGELWQHYLLFPLKAGAALLPWSLLLWPAFCVAYDPLDKAPDLSRYLRRIVVVLFVFCWLVPHAGVQSLLVLTAPAAVLVGLHFEILVRRYTHVFRCIIHGVARSISIVAAVCGVFVLLRISDVVQVGDTKLSVWLGLLLAVIIAFTLSRMSLQKWWEPHYWVHVGLLVVAGWVLWLGVLPLVRPFREISAEKQATRLVRQVPEGQTVYSTTGKALVRHAAYMPQLVRMVASPEEIPEERGLVYVLGGEDPPIAEERSWSAVSLPVVLNPQIEPRVRLRSDTPYAVSFVPHFAEREKDASASVVRMYKGVLKSGVD